MAIKTSGSVTTITPTLIKWWGLAAICFVLASGVISVIDTGFGGLLNLLGIYYVVVGSGKFHNLLLSEDGFSYRNLFSKFEYSWDEVSNFSSSSVQSSPFVTVKKVTFSLGEAPQSFADKIGNALNGRTKAMFVFGLDPDKLVKLMETYRTSRGPATIRKALEDLLPSSPASDHSPTPRASAQSSEIADMAKTVLNTKVSELGRQQRAPKVTKPGRSQPLQKRNRPAVSPRKMVPREHTPLVQEGFKLFGRRPQSD